MLQILGDRNIALCREITKRHEEIIRGKISEVLTTMESIKGEMVIIVEGNKEIEVEKFDQPVREHVEEYINSGLTTKDAIKKVAEIRKVNKNEIYKEYHKKD